MKRGRFSEAIVFVTVMFSLVMLSFETAAFTANCQSSGSCSCWPGAVPDGCELDSECIRTNTCTYTCPTLSHATNTGNTCSASTSNSCDCLGLIGLPGDCNGGICSCTASGSCIYSCSSGYDNCDGNAANGCECATPANCCGGVGNNFRYYSCATCDSQSCTSCDAWACSIQSCGTTNYCSSGSCVACSSGTKNCDADSADNCECSTPSNCCGTGIYDNYRLYNCPICDGSSCGTCNNIDCSRENCRDDSYCSSGSCVSCSDAMMNCDEDPDDGCEVDTDTDLSNCGDCDVICPDTYGACGYATCTSGNCGNTAYAAGQRSGCTDTTGCSTNGVGDIVCACDGVNSCDDTCGNVVCDSWEDINNCPYDCGGGDPELDSVTDYPDPVNNGTDVNFTVTWSNPNETEEIKIHICKNGTITAGTCEAGSWCDSASLTSDDPTSCNYTTTAADNGTKDYYAFVCDPGNNCSASTLGNFTVNIPPEVSSTSDSPDPINFGTQINFTVDWQDDNSTELIKAHICKSAAITSGVCDADSWCDSASFTTNDPTSCNYTTQASDFGSKNYYSFVCDDDGLCSGYSSGTFVVNVAPTISSLSDLPDPVSSGSDIEFSVDWNDNNAPEQVKIHICKTDSLSSGSCNAGSWCDSADFTGSDPVSCNYTSLVADSGTQSFHAFVCDDGGLCSSSTSGSFSVVVVTENRLWVTLYVSGTDSKVYIPGLGESEASSAYSTILTYPPYPFISSHFNGSLRSLTAVHGTKLAVLADNTTINHSITMIEDMSQSKILLAHTKGDWDTVMRMMPFVTAGTFLDKFSPSFAYGLGKAAIVSIMLTYDTIDLTKTGVYNKGNVRIYTQNVGESDGKVLVNVSS